MSKHRKFRVSVFPAGTVNLGDNPLKHHACTTQRNAEEWFVRHTVKSNARVIMHQGNLRGGRPKTHLDSYWFSHVRREALEKHLREHIENLRVDRGEA